jgi:transcriptional regulator with XRE-family HTH domain
MSAAAESCVGVMPLVSAPLTHKSIAKVSCGDNAYPKGLRYIDEMANSPKNHLKAWREHRKMSQEELAEKLDTAKGVISLLENGKRPLSDKWLHRLAEVLDTRPGHILDLDPSELDNDILEIWSHIAKGDRKQAASILRTFTKTGTNN